ncbi:uncharacterized protein B0J16DRAFT_375363 [Fusarium flagelliforme]|uniref:Uncharacterized protein n=1 Tax=Fusarium flagelliforme TaxID=2675880 RepID=A0A395MYA9_9HYPO|nr:uncharacterized protein B0J16DRAFT_375363 [Fusarium flagelliforme]KAH7174523.1 hypothetical protein B0J16DRAFT_375363 [Fusarium flagelliforme]RFN52717.1 hypothetical protein FIE12Z_2985 [Fusarium flagelliforme]
MPRVTHFDDDHGRLPEGLKKCGYDAETNRHYYRDKEGRYFQSAPGNKYGRLDEVVDNSPAARDFRARNPQFFPPSRREPEPRGGQQSRHLQPATTFEQLDLEAGDLASSPSKRRGCLAILHRMLSDGDVCLQQNRMTLKQCERCKAKRDVKDEALNGKLTTIGKLVRVDQNGTEYWEDSNVETTVC